MLLARSLPSSLCYANLDKNCFKSIRHLILSIYLPACLRACLPACLRACLRACLSIYLHPYHRLGS